MMITFDTATGLNASSVEEIREQVREIFIKAFKLNNGGVLNVDPSTPQGQLIDSISALIVEKDSDILYLSNMLNPLKAEGVWQDALAKLYFLSRHKAIASSAQITCTGKAGVFVPTGALIMSAQDGSRWRCRQGGAIKSDGKALLTFDCEQTGPIEAAPHSLNKIISTLAGWDTADNESAALVGQNAEGAAAFEDRRYKSVALNSRSSIQSAYSRLAALDGVIAVCMQQNRTDNPIQIDNITINPHSVYACVLGGDDNEIAQALYASVSAGCDYTGTTEVEVRDPVTRAKDRIRFSRPKDKAISIKVTIRKTDGLPTNAEESIKDIIVQNFLGTDAAQIHSVIPLNRVVMGDDLYSSRFYPSLSANNFQSVISILLSWKGEEQPSESLSIPIDTCPTLSKDDITINWQQGPLTF